MFNSENRKTSCLHSLWEKASLKVQMGQTKSVFLLRSASQHTQSDIFLFDATHKEGIKESKLP